MGHGVVGQGPRAELLVDPPAGSPARDRERPRPVPRRAAVLRFDGRTDRRDAHGRHAGRGADLPVRQPRRAADLPPRHRCLGSRSRPRAWPPPLGAARRVARRCGVPDEVPSGLPRPAGFRPGLAGERPGLAAPPARWAGGGSRDGRGHELLVGRDRRAHPGRFAALHRRHYDELAARAPARL